MGWGRIPQSGMEPQEPRSRPALYRAPDRDRRFRGRLAARGASAQRHQADHRRGDDRRRSASAPCREPVLLACEIVRPRRRARGRRHSRHRVRAGIGGRHRGAISWWRSTAARCRCGAPIRSRPASSARCGSTSPRMPPSSTRAIRLGEFPRADRHDRSASHRIDDRCAASRGSRLASGLTVLFSTFDISGSRRSARIEWLDGNRRTFISSNEAARRNIGGLAFMPAEQAPAKIELRKSFPIPFFFDRGPRLPRNRSLIQSGRASSACSTVRPPRSSRVEFAAR